MGAHKKMKTLHVSQSLSSCICSVLCRNERQLLIQWKCYAEDRTKKVAFVSRLMVRFSMFSGLAGAAIVYCN